MKFTFTIYYTDELHSYIDARDAKKFVSQECGNSQTVEADTLEDAILDIQADLKADNKTLKSLVLQNIEV